MLVVPMMQDVWKPSGMLDSLKPPTALLVPPQSEHR